MPNEDPKTEPRDYVVLSYTGERYVLQGIVKATSNVRAIADTAGNDGGRWVAVPVRNWHEEDRTAEQRDPVIRATRVIPGQTAIAVPEPPVDDGA